MFVILLTTTWGRRAPKPLVVKMSITETNKVFLLNLLKCRIVFQMFLELHVRGKSQNVLLIILKTEMFMIVKWISLCFGPLFVKISLWWKKPQTFSSGFLFFYSVSGFIYLFFFLNCIFQSLSNMKTRQTILLKSFFLLCLIFSLFFFFLNT